MIECGISTSCFYPMETRQSLAVLQKAGLKQVEIFLNSFGELEEPFIASLERQLQSCPAEVVALHPFSSGMETFFFATMYPLRFDDGLQLYRKYFSLCQRLSIPVLVFHGDYIQTPFPFARHCENFARLREEGRKYGVELCQENVVRCKCGTPDYLRKMRTLLHDDISFVLDVKQMRRANVPLEEMLTAMQGKIRHLHLSDATDVCDCAVPGTGSFAFETLFAALQQQKKTLGAAMPSRVIELYRGDFSDIDALCAGVRAIEQYAGMSRKGAGL